MSEFAYLAIGFALGAPLGYGMAFLASLGVLSRHGRLTREEMIAAELEKRREANDSVRKYRLRDNAGPPAKIRNLFPTRPKK